MSASAPVEPKPTGKALKARWMQLAVPHVDSNIVFLKAKAEEDESYPREWHVEVIPSLPV